MRQLRIGVTTDARERQLEQHGEGAFPVAFYEGDLTDNVVIWHWHDELEWIFGFRGKLAVGAGGDTITLSAGTSCFIKGGVLHNVWKADDAPCEYHTVVFHPRLIGGMDSMFWQNYIQPLVSSDFPQMIQLGDDDEFSEFFDNLWQTQEQQADGYENDVRYFLTKFVTKLSRTPMENKQQPTERDVRDMERMKAMLSFLENHYAQELTLEQIAQSACISTTECLRCFKRSIGISPISFLKENRIRRAAGLLCNTKRGVCEIAAACGFLDVSYFSKAFRKLYGMTPTAYREQNRRLWLSRERTDTA